MDHSSSNIPPKSYLVIGFVLIVSFIGCKKTNTNNDPAPSNNPPVIKGEIEIKLPGDCSLNPDHIFKTTDNDFLILGLKGLHDPNPYCDPYPLLVKIDNDLKSKFVKHPLTQSISSSKRMIETNDAYYILIQKEMDFNQPNDNNKLEIVKTDKSGNVIWQRKYDNVTFALSIQKSNDGNILILGCYGLNYPSTHINPTFLLKIDLNGSIIFRKDYSQEGLVYGSDNIIQETTGYTFIAFKYVVDSAFFEKMIPVFCKTDQFGNIVSLKEYASYRDGGTYAYSTKLIKKSGGGYILTHLPGYYPPGGGGYRHTKYLKILDENGNQTFEVDMEFFSSVHFFSVEDIFQASDGSIYVLAPIDSGLQPWRIGVVKFDSNGYFIKFKPFNKFEGRFPRSFEETGDNHIIIVSAYSQNFSISIFKIGKNLDVL